MALTVIEGEATLPDEELEKFAADLKAEILARAGGKKLKGDQKKFIKIADKEPSKHRTRFLNRMCRHSKVDAGIDEMTAIDPEKIKKFFETIMEWLPIILKLFALFAKTDDDE